MLAFISVIHVFMAVILIILVLLQDSKGGAMGMLGGSGGNTVFGSTGAASFLVKATRWIAVAFAVTSISLAYMTSQKNESVLDKFAPAGASTSGLGATEETPKIQGEPSEKTEPSDSESPKK